MEVPLYNTIQYVQYSIVIIIIVNNIDNDVILSVLLHGEGAGDSVLMSYWLCLRYFIFTDLKNKNFFTNSEGPCVVVVVIIIIIIIIIISMSENKVAVKLCLYNYIITRVFYCNSSEKHNMNCSIKIK